MFKLTKHKVLIKGLHQIDENKIILFSDGENDMIYSGTNVYGNRILGVIIGEDDEDGFLRYFHLLISDKQYYDFLYQRISLLQLIKTIESFFVIDFDYNYNELVYSLYSIDDFPNEFLPLENSLCPEFIKEPSFDYVISLKGKTSDIHLISPNDLNEVNTKFSEFLKDSTEFVNELNFNREIFVESLKTGSFQIKFKLNLNSPNQTSIFPINTDKIESFLKNFYSYVFEILPNESSDIFMNEEISSEKFISLKNELKSIYCNVDIDIPELGVEQKIIDTINFSVNNLKEMNFESSYDRIEFKNISKSGEEIPISIINKDYIPSVEKKLFPIHELQKGDLIVFDESPQTYKIQVYQFNVNTGNGSSYIQLSDDSIDRISLHVRGKENFKNTVFTKSMDEGKIIEIKGIGKKVNNKVKMITVEF